MLELSVIVPTAGRPSAITRLLRGLGRQTLPPDRFEVVVTDDGSDPPVKPALQELGLPFEFSCRWQPRAGPAAARNRAIASARGRFLVILNDDAGPPPDLLERHLRAQLSSMTPRAWLGRFDFAPECLTPFAVALGELSVLFPYAELKPDGPNPGRFFWTCNLSVPRDAVLIAGGFDEAFCRPICEDVELGHRLTKRGVFVHALAGAACLHHHHVDARWFRDRQIELGRAIVQMWRKHRDPELFPWIRGAKGDEAVLVAGLEREVASRGLALESHRERIDSIERGTTARGAFDEEVRTFAAEIAPHLKRMNEEALHLGLLAGLKGWGADEAWAWLRSLPPLTTLFFPPGSASVERRRWIDRVRQLAGCPVEVAEVPAAGQDVESALGVRILSRARGSALCFVEEGYPGEADWLRREWRDGWRSGALARPGRFRLVTRDALEPALTR